MKINAESSRRYTVVDRFYLEGREGNKRVERGMFSSYPYISVLFEIFSIKNIVIYCLYYN